MDIYQHNYQGEKVSRHQLCTPRFFYRFKSSIVNYQNDIYLNQFAGGNSKIEFTLNWYQLQEDIQGWKGRIEAIKYDKTLYKKEDLITFIPTTARYLQCRKFLKYFVNKDNVDESSLFILLKPKYPQVDYHANPNKYHQKIQSTLYTVNKYIIAANWKIRAIRDKKRWILAPIIS